MRDTEAMDAEQDRDDVGDPVCWLDRLCPECGAMPTADAAAEGRCWRCGTPTAEPDAT